jgi:HK97 family phage major capsid protein
MTSKKPLRCGASLALFPNFKELEMSEFDEIASKIEAKLDSVMNDRTASEKAVKEEIAKLFSQQHDLAKSMAEMEQKLSSAPAEKSEKKIATLGSVITGSAMYADFVAGRTRSVSAKLAAITTPDGAVQPQRIPGVQGQPEQGFDFEAAFTHVPTASNSIEYLKAKAETNAAAFMAEGADMPESNFTFETATAPVRTIGHFVRISRQLADDAPAVEAYINHRVAYGLDVAVEKQLISGDGTGQNLSGLFTEGNYTAHGLTTANFADANALDVIRRSATLLRVANFRPTVVFLNPLDYDDLIGVKDKQGRYLIANPAQNTLTNLWGLRPVLSAAIPIGNFLVADPAMGATIYDRMQTEVAMFEQDGNNVTQNLITIRAEKRLGLAVENTAAFIGGALTLSA